jgi:hypothetical protein
MLYVASIIYRITRFKDKIILCMVFLLILDLCSKIYFFVLNGYQEYTRDTTVAPPNEDMVVAMFLPVLFLSLAVTLNLRNWANYFIKIGDMAYQY